MKGLPRSCLSTNAAPTKLAMGKRRDSSWGLGGSAGGAGFGSGLQEVRRRARAMRRGARIVGSIHNCVRPIYKNYRGAKRSRASGLWGCVKAHLFDAAGIILVD